MKWVVVGWRTHLETSTSASIDRFIYHGNRRCRSTAIDNSPDHRLDWPASRRRLRQCKRPARCRNGSREKVDGRPSRTDYVLSLMGYLWPRDRLGHDMLQTTTMYSTVQPVFQLHLRSILYIGGTEPENHGLSRSRRLALSSGSQHLIARQLRSKIGSRRAITLLLGSALRGRAMSKSEK